MSAKYLAASHDKVWWHFGLGHNADRLGMIPQVLQRTFVKSMSKVFTCTALLFRQCPKSKHNLQRILPACFVHDHLGHKNLLCAHSFQTMTLSSSSDLPELDFGASTLIASIFNKLARPVKAYICLCKPYTSCYLP